MLTRLILLSSLFGALAGCASTQDFCYKQSHKCSAYWQSLVTGNAPMLNGNYTDGWRQAYYDYSTGRRCKPPALPPQKYWSSCYQDCEGQKSISEWYAGYQKGLIAAEKECGNCFHEIRPRCEGVPGEMSPASFAVESFGNPPAYSAPSSLPKNPLIPQGEAVPVPIAPAPVREVPAPKATESGVTPQIFSAPSVL